MRDVKSRSPMTIVIGRDGNGTNSACTDGPPRADRTSPRPTSMMYFCGSMSSKLYPAIPFARHSESRSATGQCDESPGSARTRRRPHSARRSSDKPHGCQVWRPEFAVNPGKRPADPRPTRWTAVTSFRAIPEQGRACHFTTSKSSNTQERSKKGSVGPYSLK